MTPSLEYVFTMREYIGSDRAKLTPKSSGPTRLIISVVDGSIKFADSDLEAQVIPPGGDWPLVNYDTGILHIDARARARTDRGDLYLYYTGTLVMGEGTKKLLAQAPDAKPTKFGDETWFAHINVETTDQRLKWMEASMLVGQGRWHVDEKGWAAEYMVYKIKN
ncbi:hypothetical protein F5B19DRAFT_272236 [Rostrohypoxylon terebratum]|nr:hypothetical protein F5B19DRAFT_272236 [Rostrohypoxylon terebratum]